MEARQDHGFDGEKLAPQFREMVRRPHQIIALGCGVGLSPVAPGTMGSVAGFLLFAALYPAHWMIKVALYAVLVAVASWSADRTGKDLRQHDHGSIVVDEIIGMCLVLEAAPMSVPWFIAAFVLFRLFDVWKPWPVHLADEARNGGFMVILDDMLAAGWAAAILFAARLSGMF